MCLVEDEGARAEPFADPNAAASASAPEPDKGKDHPRAKSLLLLLTPLLPESFEDCAPYVKASSKPV
eukprot:SAG31_NODE_1842_length_7110_cov_46.326202_2_plen_67_part_00